MTASLILSAATTSAPTSIYQRPNFRLMCLEIDVNKYSIRILRSDHKTLEICCHRVRPSAQTLKQPAAFGVDPWMPPFHLLLVFFCWFGTFGELIAMLWFGHRRSRFQWNFGKFLQRMTKCKHWEILESIKTVTKCTIAIVSISTAAPDSSALEL